MHEDEDDEGDEGEDFACRVVAEALANPEGRARLEALAEAQGGGVGAIFAWLVDEFDGTMRRLDEFSQQMSADERVCLTGLSFEVLGTWEQYTDWRFSVDIATARESLARIKAAMQHLDGADE